MKTIFNLKMHETLRIDDGSTKIVRVPGGWIYTMLRLDANTMTSVFVPTPDAGIYRSERALAEEASSEAL